ncbi:MAG: trigger factor [Alphaproteobacteria bacterium]|nr:trigger factor [Alphaproteobacteria bacterium SS10]
MQVTETTTEGLSRSYRVKIPAADLEQRVTGKLEELGKEVKMPGFRPGKVPIAMLRRKYGQSVMGEVVEQAVNDAAAKTIEDNELRPAANPQVEDVNFEEGTDLEYTLKIDLLPEFELIDFGKLKLEKPVAEVSDKEINDALERIASSNQTPQDLKRKRKSKMKDMLTIDFDGSVDGERRPGMQAEDFQIELGSGRFIDNFEEQLVGKSIGDDVTVNVTFPENYGEESLSGKAAVFEVKIKNIQELATPEIDDEMAKSFGKDTVDELKEAVKEQLENEFGQMSRGHMKRELLDKLSGEFSFDVPPAMLENEFEQIWKQITAAKEAGELSEEDAAKSDEDLEKEYRDIAERRVRLGLVLSEVGRKNEIEVDQQSLTQAMFNEARRFPGQEGQVIEYYQKNPEALATLRAPIFEEKVVDFIVEMAKVTEKKVSVEELTESPEEE